MGKDNQYDQLEEELVKKERKRRSKMKVSGKSVFLLQKKSVEKATGKVRSRKTPRSIRPIRPAHGRQARDRQNSGKKMLEDKRFQKKVEDFKCEHCGTQVKGGGFTDHCPNCLWGKHVDVNPGDRNSSCGGTIEPTQVETKGGKYIIHYKCIKCDHTFQVKSAPDDNFSEITKISSKNR